MRAVAALVVALVTPGTGCTRKAPGPMECRSFALAVAGLKSEEELVSAQLRQSIDELTRECLLTPYDRELLRCVEETGRLRACRVAFQRRLARPGRR